MPSMILYRARGHLVRLLFGSGRSCIGFIGDMVAWLVSDVMIASMTSWLYALGERYRVVGSFSSAVQPGASADRH